jgi:hypothetical protein
MDGMDSGAICGQRSWDVPNNAISARAGPFMCKMRADEENTIIPESGEERRGCGIAYILCAAVSVVVEAAFCEELVWFCGDGCGTRVLIREMVFGLCKSCTEVTGVGSAIIPRIPTTT